MTDVLVDVIQPRRPLDYRYAFGPRPQSPGHFRRLRKLGLTPKVLGRPVVYKTPGGVRIGLTDWRVDYVPRSEQLSARRRLRARRVAP